jgi:23S rRNA (cytosine1962-C5)-methyltransferase
VLPCLIYEDDHLLVVNKPAGLNTHAPSLYAGEGIYDWLRHREPRWANLAIIHRLDKETSGVLVFAKTPLANRSLTEQFTARTIHKKYLLVTDRAVARARLVVKSKLQRTGERYTSLEPHSVGGQLAETHFGMLKTPPVPAQEFQPANGVWLEAEPLTGRTHQIRVHAAEQGFPVLGDVLYGGTPAPRVYLHAAELTLSHPASGKPQTFQAPVDFSADPRSQLRTALIDPAETDAWRIVHGASDSQPHSYVDRLGDWLLSESNGELGSTQTAELDRLIRLLNARGAYHKQSSSPKLAFGAEAPEFFSIRENGAQFALSFQTGASFGLFLDQRDNRRRLLTGHIAAGFSLARVFHSRLESPTEGPVGRGSRRATSAFDARLGRSLALPGNEISGLEAAFGPSGENWGQGRTVLNTFAYTCGFSLCAALAGAHTTSIDLSKVHLEWGQRNFRLNQIDPDQHDFIYGDVFNWLRRLERKGRRFDVILLDPPTFSRSKESGVFRAERDYGRLVAQALPLLKPGGTMFASSNAAEWAPEEFVNCLNKAFLQARRPVLDMHYFPQPPDFPISRAEKAYLKTAWVRTG